MEQFEPTEAGSIDRPTSISPVSGEADASKEGAATKKVLIRTFGCQMNVYDSERMSETLATLGYSETDDPADADLAILNTCHIREKASEKVFSDLGRLRDVKRDRKGRGKDTVIAVAGCVAQAEGQEIVRRQPAVDLVLGPQSYHRLPELLKSQKAQGRAVVDTEFPDEDKFQALPERKTSGAVTAFLTVQEGCDKFCTFCVVPYTRGMEYSRPVAQIVEEATRLVSRGVREITLLGQNVNAYHGEGSETGKAQSLAALIKTLARVEGLERIRYTTSHPRDMSCDLIELHGAEPKLMPYLHLPFQAGSDRILAAMNRKHTADEYIQLVAKIRKARPDIALSTDIIVGFPGETEEEFQATLDLVREVGFAHAFSFKYSPRPGTPAASLEVQVPDDEKSDRLERLMAGIEVGQRAFNEGLVGRVVSVLFDKPGKAPGHLSGRSPYLQMVHAEGGSELLGAVRPVEILKAGSNSLHGRIVEA